MLLYICGTKDKYRELRDLHSLGSHVKSIRSIVAEAGIGVPAAAAGAERGEVDKVKAKAGANLPYDSLLQLIEHLKACVDIATSRTANWQKFCVQNEGVLSFMLHVSFALDDGLSPIVLQLLQCALCPAAPPPAAAPPPPQSQSASSASPAVATRQFKFGSKDGDQVSVEERQLASLSVRFMGALR